MKRRFDSPHFGARFAAGITEFRLWAPGAQRVDLLLQEGERNLILPMRATDQRVFSAATDRAPAGTRYQFLIDGDLRAPDPAARYQPGDVHGYSEVVDPEAFDWRDDDWRGRPWREAVVYELHVGTFTPEGTFRGVTDRLDHLAALGITAIELMPVSDFPGRRNWGYDGVLPYAPDARYGRPEDLKTLVQAAHGRGLMVLLDVVYNHFGPEGNYLHVYAPAFFTDRYHTPWGAAINFDGPDNRYVRDFFIHNALYWLTEYHLDGLRLDAVHAIFDASHPDILTEIADTVRAGPGARRHVHLVLENDNNASRYLVRAGERPRGYDAQWNDDIHHALHVLVTGEAAGYYRDYADDPLRHLGRCLTEGFAYQGEPSPYRENAPRGEDSSTLPLTSFVSFLQNHDQIGNRAFGERITALAPPAAVRAAIAILLLAPSPPLLFMGEEWGTRKPFPFFCDFEPRLAQAVSDGRRQEFARFPEFNDADVRARIPDPNADATFDSAVLDWDERASETGQDYLALYRELLRLRAREIVPRLSSTAGLHRFTRLGPRALGVTWRLHDASLSLIANLDAHDIQIALGACPPGRLLYQTHAGTEASYRAGRMPALSAICFMDSIG